MPYLSAVVFEDNYEIGSDMSLDYSGILFLHLPISTNVPRIIQTFYLQATSTVLS